VSPGAQRDVTAHDLGRDLQVVDLALGEVLERSHADASTPVKTLPRWK